MDKAHAVTHRSDPILKSFSEFAKIIKFTEVAAGEELELTCPTTNVRTMGEDALREGDSEADLPCMLRSRCKVKLSACNIYCTARYFLPAIEFFPTVVYDFKTRPL